MSSNDCQALLNCPFCGGEAVKEFDSDWGLVVRCSECPAIMTESPYLGVLDPIEAWNTREERTCHPFSGIVLGGPECREEKVWRCSECEEVLSWDYEGYDTETDGPAYCEHCGSKVTGPKVVS